MSNMQQQFIGLGHASSNEKIRTGTKTESNACPLYQSFGGRIRTQHWSNKNYSTKPGDRVKVMTHLERDTETVHKVLNVEKDDLKNSVHDDR